MVPSRTDLNQSLTVLFDTLCRAFSYNELLICSRHPIKVRRLTRDIGLYLI